MTGKTVLTIFLAVTAAVPFLSAQQKDAIRYYEELIGNMTRQVRLLQDENARLDAKVNELQQNQAELVRSNKRLLEEMDEIRELVRNDASAREKELRKLSGTDAYDLTAPLTVSPAPDSVIRVFMTWYASDEPRDITAQQLPSFEREGFTVVEWGGSQYGK